MSAEAILTRAALIIADESAWTQKAIARKASGVPCGPLSSLAVRWDMYGAMVKAKQELGLPQRDLNEADLILQEKFTTRNKEIDYFNDRNTHAACLAILTD